MIDGTHPHRGQLRGVLMVLPRRMRLQGGQLLVAVPKPLARQLGAGDGTELYWHRHRSGELVLSRHPVRKRGGRLAARDDEARIVELERQVEKLQTRLARQRESIWNEYRSQEVMRQVRLELKGYPALDAINDRLRRIEERLALRPPSPHARAGAARSMHSPSPEPSLSTS